MTPNVIGKGGPDHPVALLTPSSASGGRPGPRPMPSDAKLPAAGVLPVPLPSASLSSANARPPVLVSPTTPAGGQQTDAGGLLPAGRGTGATS